MKYWITEKNWQQAGTELVQAQVKLDVVVVDVVGIAVVEVEV